METEEHLLLDSIDHVIDSSRQVLFEVYKICQTPAEIELPAVYNETSKMDNIFSETACSATSVDQNKSIECTASFGTLGSPNDQIIEKTVNPNAEEMGDPFTEVNQIGFVPKDQIDDIIVISDVEEEEDYQYRKINQTGLVSKDQGNTIVVLDSEKEDYQYREINQTGLVSKDQDNTIVVLDSEEEEDYQYREFNQTGLVPKDQDNTIVVLDSEEEEDYQYKKDNQLGLVPKDQDNTIVVLDSEEEEDYQYKKDNQLGLVPKDQDNTIVVLDSEEEEPSKSEETLNIEETVNPNLKEIDYALKYRKKKKKTKTRKKESVNPYNKTNQIEETSDTLVIDSFEGAKLGAAARKDFEAFKSAGQLVKCVSSSTNPKQQINLSGDGQEIYKYIETNQVDTACCENTSCLVSHEVLTNCETPMNQAVGCFGVPMTEKEKEINSIVKIAERYSRNVAILQKLFDEDS